MKPSKYVTSRKSRELFGQFYTALLLFYDFSLGVCKLKPNFPSSSSHNNLIYRSFSKVAVFAVFLNSEAEMIEAERVLKLISNEFETIVLVNTGGYVFSAKFPNLIDMHRENYGRDLASYKHALDSLDLSDTSEVLLFNDSVLWTGTSIVRFIAEARRSKYQVTSLTSSNQHTSHLQSYVLHLKGDITLLSKAFRFIRISNFKRVIVEAGEKRLSHYWIANQIQIGSIHSQVSLGPLLVKYKDLYREDYSQIISLLSRRVPLNPSIHFWAPLFAQSGVVKKVLMTKNPAQLKYVPETLKELQSKVALDKN